MPADHIRSFSDCTSSQERKHRLGVYILNALFWIVSVIVSLLIIVGSFGVALIPMALAWVGRMLFAEYNVRKLQAVGVTVSERQLPAVAAAAQEVCVRFNINNDYRIIVIRSGEANAFAIRFARKRVVVILSDLLDSVIDDDEQLRALLAHELCHCVLDHGWPGRLMIYKSARFRCGREMTCDNAGLIAAGDLPHAKTLIRKLAVGRRLFDELSENEMIQESHGLYKGLSGWFLKNYLQHPPAGARIENLNQFAIEAGLPTIAKPALAARV